MNLLMSQAKSCRCPAGRQLQTEGGTGRWGPTDEAVGGHAFTAHAICGSSEGRADSVQQEPDDRDACGR